MNKQKCTPKLPYELANNETNSNLIWIQSFSLSDTSTTFINKPISSIKLSRCISIWLLLLWFHAYVYVYCDHISTHVLVLWHHQLSVVTIVQSYHSTSAALNEENNDEYRGFVRIEWQHLHHSIFVCHFINGKHYPLNQPRWI